MAGTFYATAQGLTSNDRIKPFAMQKELYDEDAWNAAMRKGTIDTFAQALLNSDKIVADDFIKRYGIDIGDKLTLEDALYNELYADRTTKKKVTEPVFDENGNYVYDENGKQVFNEIETTDYDYNLKMLNAANRLYNEKELRAYWLKMRENRSGFLKTLGDIGVTGGTVLNELFGGIEGIPGVIGVTFDEGSEFLGQLFGELAYNTLDFGTDVLGLDNPMEDPRKGYDSYGDYLKGDKTWAQRFNEFQENNTLSYELRNDLNKLAYDYSHFYNDEGELTNVGSFVMSVADTVGGMLSAMLVSYATAGVGTALTLKAQAAGKLTSTAGSFLTSSAGSIGQMTYYGAGFGRNVGDQYRYYAEQGISISSAEIVANSLVKTTVEMAIEQALGSILGRTGIDKIWGMSAKNTLGAKAGKNLTARAFGRLGKDMLQEGLEESLQETSGWIVDKLHHYINNNFQADDWNWQNIIDAALVAFVVSIGGDGAQIIGTKRVQTGNLKTNKSGEIVKNVDGEYEFETLGKLASWEVGYDLEAYTDSLKAVHDANTKFTQLYNSMSEEERKSSPKIQKAMSQYYAAYYESVASFEVLSSMYGAMGKERFAKANAILKSIRENQDAGVFNDDLRKQAQKTLVDNIWVDLTDDFDPETRGHDRLLSNIDYLMIESRAEALDAIAKAEMTKVEKTVSADDADETDDELTKLAHNIMSKDKTITKITIMADGNRPVRVGNVLLVPENLLRQDNRGAITFAADAELKLANVLTKHVLDIKGVSKSPLELVTDLYRQWSKNDEATDEEAVYNLMFDVNFFNCVLTLNEKETINFVLRLRNKIDSFKFKDTTPDKLFVKQVANLRKRWTEGAKTFYMNNLDANPDEYARFLKGEEKDNFLDAVEKVRYLFKASNKFVETPNLVTEDEWAFMEKRIDRAITDEDTKSKIREGIKSANPIDRANALFELNLLYEGAFQTLYNGEYYMPATSIGNMAFNNFLKLYGLNIKTMFDTNNLNDLEKKEIGDRTIEDFRQQQFGMLCNNRYTFMVTTDDKIVINGDDKAQGFAAVNKIIRQPESKGQIIAGKEITFETSKRKETSRRFGTDIVATSKMFRSMLSPVVHEQGIATWVSIDDVINNPLYLSEDIQNEIIEEYGDLAPDSVFVYLQAKFANESEGKVSLVRLRDGTIAIENMSKITDMFQKEVSFPTKGKYKVDKFISDKVRSSYLKNATVVFGASQNRYVDWEQKNVDGKLVWVFANRIELKAGEEAEVRFAFAHELQHAIQFEKSMNAGITQKPLRLFSPDEQIEIIKTVKKIAPELFPKNITDEQTRNIVNDYLYFGTGELQAMGLSSTKEMAAYPVMSKRDANGRVTITLPNGQSYSSKGIVNPAHARNKIVQNIKDILANKFSKLTVKIDVSNKEKRFNEGNKLIRKMALDKNLRTIDNKIHALYQVLGYDMTFEQFNNTELVVANVNGKWYLVSNYKGIESVLRTSSDFSSNITIKYGTIVPKDIKDLHFNRDVFTPELVFDERKRKNRYDEKIDFNELSNVDQSLTEFVDPWTGEDISYTIQMQLKDELSKDGFIDESYTHEDFETIIDRVDPALKEWMYDYLNRKPGERTQAAVKDAITKTLIKNPNIRKNSLLKLYENRGKNYQNLTFEEFLNSDIVIYRFESATPFGVINDSFVSAYINDAADKFPKRLKTVEPGVIDEFNLEFDETKPEDLQILELADGHVYLSNIKVKDIQLYIDGSSEILVKPDTFKLGTTVEFGVGLDESVTKTKGAIPLNARHFGNSVREYFTLENLIERIYYYLDYAPVRVKSELMPLAKKVIPAAKRLYEIRAKAGLRPTIRKLAKAEDSLGLGGLYAPHSNDLTYYDYYSNDPHVLLHELVHFCLVNTIDLAERYTGPNKALIQSQYDVDADIMAAGKAIKMLYDYTMQVGVPRYKYYGLTDSQEFAAELTNVNFIDYLESIKLTDKINNIMLTLFDTETDNVLEALKISADYIFENAQYMADGPDTSSIKTDNLYTGPVYDGNTLIEESAELFSVAEFGPKIVDALNKMMSIKKNDGETDADYIRRLLNDEKSKKYIEELLMKYDNVIDSIYVDGEFPLYKGKVSNYSVAPKSNNIKSDETTNKTKSDEITDKTNVEERAETKESDTGGQNKQVKTYKKRKGAIVDRREILTKEPEKGTYYVRTVNKPPKKATILKTIYDVDYNEQEPDRTPGHRNAKYFYRKFLYRVYFRNKYGNVSYRDVYEEWTYKDDIDRRWFTKKEVENSNLKYFKGDKEQLQMKGGLGQFIVYSTYHKMPEPIQNKIDGSEAGTLTENDVLRYLFETPENEQPKNFFKIVNDCFYNNQSIHSLAELKKLKEFLPKFMALQRFLSKNNQKDWLYDNYDFAELEQIWIDWLNSSDANKKALLKDLESYGLKINQDVYESPDSPEFGALDKNQRYRIRQAQSLLIDDLFAMHSLMSLYNGTIADGGYIAKTVRKDAFDLINYNKPNKFRNTVDSRNVGSIDESVGTDKEGRDASRSRGEVLEDISESEEAEAYYEMAIGEGSNEKRNAMVRTIKNPTTPIGRRIAEIIQREASRQGLVTDEIYEAYNTFIESISLVTVVSDKNLYDLYGALAKDIGNDVSELSSDHLESIYFLADILESTDRNEERHQKYLEIAKENRKIEREDRNLKQSIERQANETIAGYISKTNRALFLKHNGDLFEEDGSTVKLKDDILYESVNGEQILRSREELVDIKSRMNEISKAVRLNHAYDSKENYKLYSDNKKLRADIEKLKQKKSHNADSDKVYRLALGNGNTLDVDEESHVPESLKKIIELGHAKLVATEVQRFSKSEEVESEDGEIKKVYTEKHALQVYDVFLKNSAEILADIGQDGANEIVDFYLMNKSWIIAGDTDRIALNIQQLLLGYLYSKHYKNDLNFDEERLNAITTYLTTQASIAGSWLSNQKTILGMLKKIDSSEIVDQALMDYIGVPMDDEDRANLKKVLATMRNISDDKNTAQKKFLAAKKVFEETLIGKYKGNKKTILTKLLTIERAMMLSSPTTWLRNIASNVIVTGGNIASSEIGEKANKLLNKMFNKSEKFKDRVGQYKIVGTKVSKKTSDFVDEAFFNSGFVDTIGIGLSRYDPRQIDKYSSGDNIVDMMARNIGQSIKNDITFGGNNWASDVGNRLISKIFKMTSDDPFIKNKIKYYLNKIITEEMAKNPNLKLELTSNSMYGLSNDMLELFVKSYEMAAFDYMHGSNWIMDMERQLKIQCGEKGYFVYKQIFPFLGSAWNWTLEGMRYTPLGLAKAIINLNKLENTIEKMEKQRQEGKKVVSSEFAQYIARRNLGKGVIGTTGFIIGMILRSLGMAFADEEDDKYKLSVGNIKIDISDLIGSQGVLLGIATCSQFIKKEKDPTKLIASVLNQFFDDTAIESIISTFRGSYNTGTGDTLREIVIDDIPSMFWPNILKTMAKIANKNGPTYDPGFKGWLQEAFARSVPGGAYILGLNFDVDPYTGKAQSFWSADTLGYAMNQFLPFDIEKIEPNSMSNNELEAIGLGINKSSLTGNYKIDDEKITLTADEQYKVNKFYGNLNSKTLTELRQGSKEIQLEDGSYKVVKYSAMTEKQKKAAIESTLSTNSRYSKIYILTSTGRYKYYANDSEYKKLRELGITANVYKQTGKNKGFVKI